MISSELLPLLSALIIGGANFASILLAYYRMERRVDKKIAKYWRELKESEEGQDLFTIFKELRDLLKSKETQKLFKEAEELMSEFRVLLKKIKERSEAPEEESDEDTPVLPRLGK